MTVEFGLTPDGKWDFELAELVASTAAAGFTGLGIGAALASPTCAELLRDNGLRAHELMALILSDDADATVSQAEALAEAATVVDAEWALTVFTSPLNSATMPIIERCAAIFADAGTKMAVEFSPLGGVPSIEAGLAVVAAAGADRAGLVIDTWHFSYSEHNWESLRTIPLEAIAEVQFTDALEPTSNSGVRETLHRRALPGDGVLELERFASILRQRGWSGMVSVEVLSAELRERPINEIAQSAYAATARYWS